MHRTRHTLKHTLISILLIAPNLGAYAQIKVIASPTLPTRTKTAAPSFPLPQSATPDFPALFGSTEESSEPTQNAASAEAYNPINSEKAFVPYEEVILPAAGIVTSQSITSVGEGINLNDEVGVIKIPNLGTNEVLDLLSQLTGKAVLRHQSLPAINISFFSQGKMNRAEAILAVESLLAMNGIAISPMGNNFLKAVLSGSINNLVPPVWTGTTLGATPSAMIFTKVFNLQFLSAEEVTPLVQSMMSQGSPIGYPKAHILMVTDALHNLQHIENILKSIDRPLPLKTEMFFYQVKSTSAKSLLESMQNMIDRSLRFRLDQESMFITDDRTNQLIFFTHPDNKNLIYDIIHKLDINVSPLTRTELFNIKHAESKEVARILQEVITGQQEIKKAEGGGDQGAGVPERSGLFSGQITITADERANTILASGSEADLTQLGDMINKIDVLLAQVRIEVIITEVALTKGDTRGIDAFGMTYNTTTAGTANGNKNYVISPGDFGGLSIPGVTTGPNGFSFSAVLNAIKTNSNVTVLSAPTIVTTHNREATISIGDERPIVTGTTSNVTDSSSTAVNSSIQYKKVGLELKVKPLIGSNGVIQMEIEQKIDNYQGDVAVSDGLEPQPVFATRQANSYVSCRDGEMVVLGGLQKVDKNNSSGRMEILGRIPILGRLFQRDEDSETRTELLIFIRPVIVKTTDEVNADAKLKLSQIESSERVQKYLETGTFREPEKKKGFWGRLFSWF
jgi:general secretion pathway protein D